VRPRLFREPLDCVVTVDLIVDERPVLALALERAAHILNYKRETIFGPVGIGARLRLLSVRSADENYGPRSGALREVDDGGKLHAIAHRHHLFARLDWRRNGIEQNCDD